MKRIHIHVIGRQATVFPAALNFNPARSVIGPVGPCSPVSTSDKNKVNGPGLTGITSRACRILRGASLASSEIAIAAEAPRSV